MREELEETQYLSEFAFAMWSRWCSVSQPRNYNHLCEQARDLQEIIDARQQRLNDLLGQKK